MVKFAGEDLCFSWEKGVEVTEKRDNAMRKEKQNWAKRLRKAGPRRKYRGKRSFLLCSLFSLKSKWAALPHGDSSDLECH